MEIRPLDLAELHRVTEIDVTEDGTTVLEQRGRDVSTRTEIWSRRSRSAARWAEFESRWRVFLPDAGAALGAFEAGRLVGIATLRRGVRPGTDQLEALFVDRAHRRRGVGSLLVDRIVALARDGGARTLYVSATPSESAVGCIGAAGSGPPTSRSRSCWNSSRKTCT